MPDRRLPIPLVTAAKPIELRTHGDFVEWLERAGGTLAVTTYNSGKLAFFTAAGGELVSRFWSFPRPMGLAVDGQRFALATRDHAWLFDLVLDNDLAPRFALAKVYATGRLDVHEVAFDRRGLLMANTRFNCVARTSERKNFLRHWQPAFITEIVAHDCCHLNGIGVRQDRLAMATAFCDSAAPDAWRNGDRFRSGVLIDVQQGEIAARGLCLPHSPRWHAGRWWFCNSGEGMLATVGQAGSKCEPLAQLPGFTRGLTFAAGRAVVGLSRIRKRHILDAPPVRERFTRLRSGVALVDPRSGRATGLLEFIRGGREVFDVAFLPGASPPELGTSTG